MKKNILLLFCLGILLALPNLAVSDGLDFGRVTNWYVQDESTIIYYNQNRPVAKIVLEDCTVNQSSNIRLPKSYVCEEDGLIVDGEKCSIVSIKSASSGSF
jgi:hypothetical protein